jgi:predicted CXXCH cytochrome family protein
MLLPAEANVLADFENRSFSSKGITAHFARRGADYLIRAEGPDGKPAEFTVKYVIGVDPVQQYVVEFPGGKLQCLTVAWDVRARRWYSLYPGQKIALDDPLHWTGRYQNWNLMCGECHTTNYRKGYDAVADSYATAWSEFDVGCESCHGPGGDHVAWSGKRGPKRRGYGEAGATVGLQVDLRAAGGRAEVDACATCHARRHRVGAERLPGDPLLDEFMPELMTEPLYHADGQIHDEVYEYGSFRQSKMYLRGVRCSDCHDPHSGRTKAEGNALCLSCHGERPNPAFPTLRAKAYDAPTHHFHAQGTKAAQCVSCHMATRNYMIVHERHDHFFRIPRPDESVRWGTPNACNACHTDKSAAWATAAVVRWYGDRRPADSRFVEAVAAGQAGEANAEAALRAVAADTARSPMARATALSLLRGDDPETSGILATGTADPDPIVRATAAGGLENLPATRRIALAVPLLHDPVRAVRVQAARVLAPVPVNLFTQAQRGDLDSALVEYRQGLLAMADMPSTHLNLGVLETDLGRLDLAEQAYRKALSMDPYFIPARQNLATIYNRLGRNAEAERELREGIRQAPDHGELHYSLGLLLAEGGRYEEAANSLREAAKLLPNQARIRYNLGLTLQRIGRNAEAERALLDAARLDAGDPEAAYALAVFYLSQRRFKEALPYAERYAQLNPGDEQANGLLRQIRQALGE